MIEILVFIGVGIVFFCLSWWATGKVMDRQYKATRKNIDRESKK